MFITGFNNLAYHSLNKGDITDDSCRLCGEESEQAWHLANECPATTSLRLDAFGTEGVHTKWTIPALVSFLAKPSVERIIATRVDGYFDYPAGMREGE